MKTMEQRISKARKSGKLFAFHHIHRDAAGEVDEVHCKCCGHQIKGYRPVGDPEPRRIDGEHPTILLNQLVKVGPFPTYQEFVIEHEDGSKHVTHLCRHCGEHGHSQETLEAIFAADVAHMIEGMADAGFPQAEIDRFAEEMGRRVPTRLRLKRPEE